MEEEPRTRTCERVLELLAAEDRGSPVYRQLEPLRALTVSARTTPLLARSDLHQRRHVRPLKYEQLENVHTHIRLTAFFPRTTWVSRHQKGKPFWILLKQEMMGWQWHQLDHMQIISTSLQTDNHASTPSLNFYGPDVFLTPSQQCQSTEGKHWRLGNVQS